MKILKVKCLAPTRLDNYLTQQYPALTPGRLNKALRENKIKLNGKKQPLSTRVMAGDEIKLFILDDVLDADRRVEGPAWKNARTPAQVVYDCPQILIVNKPAGVAVDGPEDDTLLNRALLYLNKQGEYKENDLYTPALCHRLDTGTSGLVIIAKTPEAEELFLAAIKSREVKKTYLCVTFGRPTPPDATLGGYLLKDADRGIVKIVEDKQPGAKDVETQYETIAVSGRLALLKVRLITGRTHQIRAHMASIGCPILGDSKYGNNAANRELRLKYQALCAWELKFPAKISDERFMELSADYEQEQRELKDRAAALQAELDKSQAATVNAEKFMGIVRKHLAFEELTPTLLREMIDKIVVHECSYDENGTRRQDIEIYYSFVGKIDLPEA